MNNKYALSESSFVCNKSFCKEQKLCQNNESPNFSFN